MIAPHGRFDFGLSEQEEARASKLHKESIVFDLLSMHAGSTIFQRYPESLLTDLRKRLRLARNGFEMLSEAIYWPFEMALLGKSDLIREWMLGSGLTCGTYDIDIVTGESIDPHSCEWDTMIRRYAQLPWLRYITTAEEIRSAKRDNAVALYANHQPVIPPPRNLDSFDVAYRKGLRSFMLTYNRMDHVGVGCTERVDAGLSMYGIDVVRCCNDLGIIVDVSHCGYLTTMDACRHSKSPVNANHTMARGVHAHPRGKSDDALRAIADTGGVIGVVAVPYFLSDTATPSLEHMLDHIDYIVNLVGYRHVALGTDWPLQAPDDVLVATMGSEQYRKQVGWSSRQKRDVTQRLVGFDGCRDLINVTRGLVKRKYSDEQIRAILGENALRVFEAVCG